MSQSQHTNYYYITVMCRIKELYILQERKLGKLFPYVFNGKKIKELFTPT